MSWFYTGPPAPPPPVVNGFVPEIETVVLAVESDVIDLSVLEIDSKYATLVVINATVLIVDVDYEIITAQQIHLLNGVVPAGTSFSFWKFDIVGGVTPIQEVVTTSEETGIINLVTDLVINSKLATLVIMNATLLTVDIEYEVTGPKQITLKGGQVVPIGTVFNFIKMDN